MADDRITYRWMTPGDGPALVRLHRRAILLSGVRPYSRDIALSWADGLHAEGYARAAERGEAIEVAELHGAVVGFCGVSDGEIRGLYVDPAYTRRGVASGLMARALARMAEQGLERTAVTATLSGVAFYEAAGFHTVRRVLHPIRGGLEMPAAEMERAL